MEPCYKPQFIPPVCRMILGLSQRMFSQAFICLALSWLRVMGDRMKMGENGRFWEKMYIFKVNVGLCHPVSKKNSVLQEASSSSSQKQRLCGQYQESEEDGKLLKQKQEICFQGQNIGKIGSKTLHTAKQGLGSQLIKYVISDKNAQSFSISVPSYVNNVQILPQSRDDQKTSYL